ncbi:MAG: hypothetical protein KatS3mg129_1988 [Leptospiraceae bacterium]|nr:MAG: hypothetical protein KatS3mg129_1988 [Leptospiraceae bacterium]
MAIAYSAIANDGKIVKPFIVKEIRDPATGKILKKYEPTIIQHLDISKQTLKTCKKRITRSCFNRYWTIFKST